MTEYNNEAANVISGTFEWVIKKICTCNCDEAQEAIFSPVFTISVSNQESKWQLYLWPQGEDSPRDYLSLFLRSPNNHEIKASYTFYLIDNENKTLLIKESGEGVFGNLCINGFQEFLNNSIIKKKNNNFSIICNIKINSESATLIKINDEKKKSKDCWTQSCSLEKLLDNDEYSDVSLNVGGQIFAAHKCLLAIKSSVFAAMLRHDMKEKESNTIIIEDVKPEVFKEILRFIYVGKIDEVEENIAIDLYVAADKYSLTELMDLCVESLHDTLSCTNAIEYLKLADHYNLHDFKQTVLNFIGRYPKMIVHLPEFKQLENTKPHLLFEISCVMASQINTLRNLE